MSVDLAEIERRADGLVRVLAADVPALNGTGSGTGTWGTLIHIERPVSGYVTCKASNAWAVVRYVRDGVNGAQIMQTFPIGPSSSCLIPVMAGTVRIEVQADSDTIQQHDLVGGWGTGVSPAAANAYVMARWSLQPPAQNAATMVTLTSGATNSQLGPATIAASGGTATLRPPDRCRRLVLSTTTGVDVRRFVYENGAVSMAEGGCNGTREFMVGPFESILLTNNTGGACEFFASWYPVED